MNELDKVPADVETTMTELFQRAFRVAGCDPACHCCEESIPLGSVFKLAQVEDCDEMLCNKCSAGMLIEKHEKEIQDRIDSRKGFTRKHISG